MLLTKSLLGLGLLLPSIAFSQASYLNDFRNDTNGVYLIDQEYVGDIKYITTGKSLTHGETDIVRFKDYSVILKDKINPNLKGGEYSLRWKGREIGSDYQREIFLCDNSSGGQCFHVAALVEPGACV